MMLLTTREGASYITFVLSVSLFVYMCVCQTITFESLDVLIAHPVHL